MGAGGLLSARVWEEEAEERRIRRREEDVRLRWRRAVEVDESSPSISLGASPYTGVRLDLRPRGKRCYAEPFFVRRWLFFSRRRLPLTVVKIR